MNSNQSGGQEKPQFYTISKRLVWLLFALLVGVVAGLAVQKGFQTINSNSVLSNPELKGWLVIGNTEHSLDDGQIALPTGTKFQIKLRSAQAGLLSIYAINPDGKRSKEAIWSGVIEASGTITTPVVRLDGVKGQETIAVELRDKFRNALIAQTVFKLWHV
jgi:hypothetical protein